MTKKMTESFCEVRKEGDCRPRDVCTHCDFVAYKNPKALVGVVASDDLGRVLLVRRNIEPRKGLWDLPRGYHENGETTEEGAKREAHEEAGAKMQIDALLGVYEVPDAGLVSLIYRAKLTSDELAPGPESMEARLFALDQIPWNDLAFPHIKPALEFYQKTVGKTDFQPDRKSFPRLGKQKPGI